jgi:hypothetical protein
VRKGRMLGSVKAKAEWLSYSIWPPTISHDLLTDSEQLKVLSLFPLCDNLERVPGAYSLSLPGGLSGVFADSIDSVVAQRPDGQPRLSIRSSVVVIEGN